MDLLKKIVEKIRQGMLKEMFHEFQWIYGYGVQYKWSIIWYICLGLFGIATGMVSSVLSKYIIDSVTGFAGMAILPAAAAYVIMQFFVIGINAWSSKISARIELKVDQEIRAEVFDQIMEADWEALQNFHSGDLLNRLNSDVSIVSSSVIGWIPSFLTRICQFAGAFGIILYYDSTLALLALVTAPVTLLCSRKVTKIMHSYNKKLRKAGSELMAFSGESLQNMQLIKALGLGETYGKKLRQVQNKYRDTSLEYKHFTVGTSALMSIAGTTVTVLCFCWGVYRLWNGYITYGTMTLFLQMASTLSGTFTALIYMVPQAISAATSAGRIMAVTELPKERREKAECVKELLETQDAVLVKVEHIDFQYANGKTVLKHADFHADSGEIVALVGPSGEGKTTMLRILLGLVSVQSGSVTVRGETHTEKIPVNAATRALFAHVPQENVLFAGTIAENLRLIKPDATDEELDEVLRIACAYEFVHKNPEGLYSEVKEKGGGFSEGQVQRLAIARAMLSDAPVLLLDEATSALDVATERKVLRNIMEYKKACTCIITTHRPSVLKICNRIYRIADTEVTVMNEKEVEQLIIDF